MDRKREFLGLSLPLFGECSSESHSNQRGMYESEEQDTTMFRNVGTGKKRPGETGKGKGEKGKWKQKAEKMTQISKSFVIFLSCRNI